VSVGFVDPTSIAEAATTAQPFVCVTVQFVANARQFAYIHSIKIERRQAALGSRVVYAKTALDSFTPLGPRERRHRSRSLAGGMNNALCQPLIGKRRVISDQPSDLKEGRAVATAALIGECLGRDVNPSSFFLLCVKFLHLNLQRPSGMLWALKGSCAKARLKVA
jgi:hypothetical protein